MTHESPINDYNVAVCNCRIVNVRQKQKEAFGIVQDETLGSAQDPRNPNRRVLWLVTQDVE